MFELFIQDIGDDSIENGIVQRETLNKLAVELGLDKLIISSTRNLAHNTNIYGDALEALIGAIYLDQGYRVAKKFVYETLIKQHLNIETVLKSEVDFKSRLIEWGQKNKVDVFFEVTDASYDAQNNPVFSSCVKVGGVEIGSGKGYSKKESHQMAAKVAIRKLRESNELQEVIARTASTGISNPDNRMEKTSLPDFEEEQNTEEL